MHKASDPALLAVKPHSSSTDWAEPVTVLALQVVVENLAESTVIPCIITSNREEIVFDF